MPTDLKIVVPICKIDARRQEVWGVLSEEADNRVEVFDCQTSNPPFIKLERFGYIPHDPRKATNLFIVRY